VTFCTALRKRSFEDQAGAPSVEGRIEGARAIQNRDVEAAWPKSKRQRRRDVLVSINTEEMGVAVLWKLH